MTRPGTAMTLEDKLTAAAAKGTAADVDRLLREGAEVNGLNRFGRSAIQVGVNTARKFETQKSTIAHYVKDFVKLVI